MMLRCWRLSLRRRRVLLKLGVSLSVSRVSQSLLWILYFREAHLISLYYLCTWAGPYYPMYIDTRARRHTKLCIFVFISMSVLVLLTFLNYFNFFFWQCYNVLTAFVEMWHNETSSLHMPCRLVI
jgi:hypothetical protein